MKETQLNLTEVFDNEEIAFIQQEIEKLENEPEKGLKDLQEELSRIMADLSDIDNRNRLPGCRIDIEFREKKIGALKAQQKIIKARETRSAILLGQKQNLFNS